MVQISLVRTWTHYPQRFDEWSNRYSYSRWICIFIEILLENYVSASSDYRIEIEEGYEDVSLPTGLHFVNKTLWSCPRWHDKKHFLFHNKYEICPQLLSNHGVYLSGVFPAANYTLYMTIWGKVTDTVVLFIHAMPCLRSCFVVERLPCLAMRAEQGDLERCVCGQESVKNHDFYTVKKGDRSANPADIHRGCCDLYTSCVSLNIACWTGDNG